MQDTFVRAFSSIDGFRRRSTLRTWLFTIARNLVLDQARNAKARRADREIEDSHAATDNDALSHVVAEETAMRLRRAVERLTPMQKDVFTLRVSHGLSYREIAEALDTSEGAARVHYFNAMQAIQDEIHD